MFKERMGFDPTENKPEQENFKELLEKPMVRVELARFLRKNFNLPDYDLDDIIQETSLRAINAMDKNQFNGNKEKLMPWLRAIARNFTVNWLRKKGREIPDSEIEEVAQNEQEQLNWEKFNDVEKFLNLLKDKNEDFYQVIYLYHLEGLTYEEIAEKIEIPKGTVMSRLYRARQLLNRLVQEEKDKELN